MGYVQSPHSVFLHDKKYGFKGTSGYKNAFIKKEQYQSLTGFLQNNQLTLIDEFYKDSTRKQKSMIMDDYIFDGEHLFLSAYKNRTTKLDYFPKAMYHCVWNKLMEVVEKIESLPILWKKSQFCSDLGWDEVNHPSSEEMKRDYWYEIHIEKNCCDIWEFKSMWGKNQLLLKTNNLLESKIENVWWAAVEFIKFYTQE